MNETFEDALVKGFEKHIPSINLPDLDDRHIVATAIKAQANIIVTINTKDFPKEELKRWNIVCQHPDDFICDMMKNNSTKDKVVQAFQKQVKNLKNPPLTSEQVLETLKNNGLKKLEKNYKQILLQHG
jgi:gamma-glutamylcysteine synthetase